MMAQDDDHGEALRSVEADRLYAQHEWRAGRHAPGWPVNGDRFQVWHAADVLHVGRCLIAVEDEETGAMRWIVRAEEGGQWTLALRADGFQRIDGVKYWGTRTAGARRV